MKCTACSYENRPGVKFCEQCGSQMPHEQTADNLRKYCPSCGQAQGPDNKFCQNCGAALDGQSVQAAPVPVSSPMGVPVYAAPPPRRKGLRGCLWPLLGIFTGLFFVCSLLFWLTLIRIPAVPRASSSPVIVVKTIRTLRILQTNLAPPPSVTGFADQFHIGGNKKNAGQFQVVTEANGADDQTVKLVPDPVACEPEVNLGNPKVSRRQVFFLQEAAGAGPLIYDFENTGDPLSGAAYEYYAQWIMTNFATGETTTAIKSCWITDGHLSCYGPDTNTYNYAEMHIFSENPACWTPVAGFPFDGVDPAPANDDAWTCHTPNEISGIYQTKYSDLDNVELLPDSAYWRIGLTDQITFYEGIPYSESYDIVLPLRLNTEVFDTELNQWRSFESTCWRYTTWTVDCMGWDPEQFSSMRWALYSEPTDKCTEPMASGMSGSIVAEEPEPQACIPDIVQQINNYGPLVMRSRSSANWTLTTTPFLVHLPSLTGLEIDKLRFYATYDVYDSQGNQVMENKRFECSEAVAFAIPCEGPSVQDDQKVTMHLYYLGDTCNELLSERTWEPVAKLPEEPQVAAPPDRCGLYDNIDMSIVYLDWTSGAPLQFYFKMPGGVPGLEKKISGDTGDWEYTAKIGDYTSSNCDIIQGYGERLYCAISLPSGYSNAMRPLTLSVNGCNSLVYSNQTAFLPGIEGSSSGGSTSGGGGGSSGGGGGSGGDVCGTQPADSGSVEWSDWCSCRWDNGLSC